METVTACPLGSNCEEIKDNKIHRCAWYVTMTGTDAQGQKHQEESKCAMAWMPILQVEVAGTNRGQTAAIESMRNASIKRQDIALYQMRNIDAKTIAPQ